MPLTLPGLQLGQLHVYHLDIKSVLLYAVFRPRDGIYVSEGAEERGIAVAAHLPPAMARSTWCVDMGMPCLSSIISTEYI